MSGVCPCCGQAVDNEGLTVSLDTNTLSRSGRTVPLPARVAEIVSVLLKRYPGSVSRDGLVGRIYGVGDTPRDPMAAIRVQLSTARARLRSFGADIRYMPRAGYRVVINKEWKHEGD